MAKKNTSKVDPRTLARKPTKQEVKYAKARSKVEGIPSDTSAKGLRTAGKAAALVAINAVPEARLARTAAKFVTASKAKKLESGASMIKTKTFTQGSKARVTNATPKRMGSVKSSPVTGSKTTVSWKTKELSPKQQANLTVGRVVREKGSKVGTYIKGVATGATAENIRQSANKKKKK